ncbi:M20 metallopeptidase family protein [Fenollaria sporofastidiosus]|uniref:M20 metallopeptidase family protein n=1 Tax=Fenollaria sporofastidiosus TaxID=2811778 RepID=UPI001C007368|nr:M20 family metallopeptidase [Fenollaria sporofastidiosus]
MNKFYELAEKMQDETIKMRRDLHQIPEIGLEVEKTCDYIEGKLKEIGLEPVRYGNSGISAIIDSGKDGKCLLLRADMDALPMSEDNDLPFKATNGCAHTCGHDTHAAMLMSAAKILNDNKDQFKGKVKLMFQSAEEIFKGSRFMIEHGILENPKVDAALAMHTSLDEEPGSFGYNLGYMTTSCDNFKITIVGKGSHGAYPHTAHDPIYAGVLLYTHFMELIAREKDPNKVATLTFGQFTAGSNSNIIPNECVMQGTLRTYQPEVREYTKARMADAVKAVEVLTQTKIDVDYFSGVPSLYSDPSLTEFFADTIKENMDLKAIKDSKIMASEDMACVAEKVKTTYLMLNMKTKGCDAAHHNPKVIFNEDALKYGTAIFAICAVNYLNKFDK